LVAHLKIELDNYMPMVYTLNFKRSHKHRTMPKIALAQTLI